MMTFDHAANQHGPSTRGRALLAALDRIPEAYRLPIWLRFCMGFGSAETAETLAIPEQSLPRLIAVGLRKLHQALGNAQPLQDASALTRALAAGPRETAPSSLLDRISATAAHFAAVAPVQRPATRWSNRSSHLFSTATQPFNSRDKLTLGDFESFHYN